MKCFFERKLRKTVRCLRRVSSSIHEEQVNSRRYVHIKRDFNDQICIFNTHMYVIRGFQDRLSQYKLGKLSNIEITTDFKNFLKRTSIKSNIKMNGRRFVVMRG